MLPNCLIIGAPRAGTSSLSVYLGQHPDVFFPDANGINFFFSANYDRGTGWYQKWFDKRINQRIVGEQAPSYLAAPDVPKRIHDTIPACKLIVAFRHPVDRAYSHHWLHVTKAEELYSFGERVERELLLIRKGEAPPHGYVTQGLYGLHMERYLRYYGVKDFCMVVFERLRRNPRGTFERICEFLCIDAGIAPQNVADVKNAALRVYEDIRSPHLMKCFYHVRKMLRRLSSRYGASSVRLSRLWHAANWGLIRTYRLLNLRPGPHADMDPEVSQRLMDVYAPDIRKLERLTGLDLSLWE